MPTTPPVHEATDVPTAPLDASAIFAALANARRRRVLRYLTQTAGAATLGDLTEQVAIDEAVVAPDRRARIRTDLYHAQLPTLADRGIIAFDPDLGTVRLLAAGHDLQPYLDLAAEHHR